MTVASGGSTPEAWRIDARVGVVFTPDSEITRDIFRVASTAAIVSYGQPGDTRFALELRDEYDQTVGIVPAPTAGEVAASFEVSTEILVQSGARRRSLPLTRPAAPAGRRREQQI